MTKARALAAVAVLSAWSGGARAASDRVELVLSDCDALGRSALEEHLALELSTLGLANVAARLQLRCELTSVAVELTQASGRRYPVAVRVELDGTAKAARERLVALAASELIAQAEREGSESVPRRARAAEPAPAVRAAPRPADAAQHSSAKLPRSELFAAGNAAFTGEPRAALWGGTLGTRWGIGCTWSVLVDTRFERGAEALRLARVHWTLLSGFVGAGANAAAGPLRLSAGLGVRAGWLALDATASAPNEGSRLTAPWAGVALPLRVAFDWGSSAMPFFGAEAGYVAVPVTGIVDDGSVLVEQRGAWLSGSVGVAVAL